MMLEESVVCVLNFIIVCVREVGKMSYREIDAIGNYHGGLRVKVEGDKYFWSIENYDGYYWKEIPKSLYDELIKHDDERDKTLEGVYEIFGVYMEDE